uniref:Uncharacterized protein n=1 Tax=Arundo donax TaxID=35708 RepID=A0A0A8Y816_ARUDO
MLLRSSNLN